MRAAEICALVLIVSFSAPAPGCAQAVPPQAAPLPPPGFVPPYEIMRTVRAAGFDPLAPPLREGTTYVLRATDFRGILMRVVIDARTGAIRDANRIIPALGTYDPYADGEVGMAPPYGSLPDVPPAYGSPPPYGAPDITPSLPPSAAHTRASGATAPPLPRPRPAELVSRKPADDVMTGDKAQPKSSAESSTATSAPISPRTAPSVLSTTPTIVAPSAVAPPVND